METYDELLHACNVALSSLVKQVIATSEGDNGGKVSEEIMPSPEEEGKGGPEEEEFSPSPEEEGKGGQENQQGTLGFNLVFFFFSCRVYQ